MEERLLALLRMALKQHATDLHFSIRNETVTLQMRCGLQIKDIETEPQDLKLFRYLQYRANLELSDPGAGRRPAGLRSTWMEKSWPCGLRSCTV